MIRKKLYLYLLMLTSVMLAACGQSEEDSIVEPTETVTLIIAAPQSSSTRAVGDPGEAVKEGEDWDEMAVIIAYTKLEGESVAGNNLPVVIKTLTKKEFEALPHYNNDQNSPYRMLALSVWRGTVHIYGVTYTGGADDGSLRDAIHSCKDEIAVKALTISNDYASGDTKKFLSVATGYYKDDKGNLAEYEINKNADYGEIKPIPSMRLTRLAAKIDIQWDAQDAYTQGYTDVKVNGFTFYNTSDETETGKGKGCLFPKLYEGSETFAGQSEFLNTSPISKRNGRVYHYVFPCKGTPHVKFHLTATKDGSPQNQDYTFQFPGELQQATWYKINTTIRGVTGNTTITLNN